MKLLVCLRISLTLVLMIKVGDCVTTQWHKLVSSKHYENTRLVMETKNSLKSQYTFKENPLTTTRITCSKFCVNHLKCVGFNFFTNRTHYICEYLLENFCSQKKRIALQIWPGGTVWDKVRPGMTKACLNQQFENKSTTNYCEIGRSGCRSGSNISSSAWPGCEKCVKTCSDCAKLNNISGQNEHQCTLWPDGPYKPPIFASCKGNATFLLRRQVNTTTGTVRKNYLMSLNDMHRLSRLGVYNSLRFVFRFNSTNGYYKVYQNFFIDEKGSLMNITTSTTVNDGFNLSSKALQPSPWVNTNSHCGSFWYLSSTQSSASLDCPGGGISVFGKVKITATSMETGIHWPEATKENEILEYADIRMDF